jgi:hypothetical protein
VRIESNLRRLEGVRSSHSSLAAGTVTVQWRPGIFLDLPRLKEAVLRWRGAVRYGGAVVTVVGVIDAPDDTAGAPTSLLLRASGTGQQFRLQARGGSADLSQIRRGEPLRVTGRVVKEREGPNHEIWLELERDPGAK